MPASKLDIANKALAMVGARQITSFNQSGSNEAAAIANVYDDILDEVLSEHPWSFAQKRVALDYVVPADVSRTIEGRIYTPVTVTGATKANPCVITAADHGLTEGDRIKLVGIGGMTQINNLFFKIKTVTADTFALIDEDTEANINSSAYTAYTSGGQIYLANESDPIIITAATAANPVQITSAAHGLATGDWIKIIGIVGMTELNDTFFIVAGAATNTFTLTDTDGAAIDGSAYTAWTAGGQILEAIDLPMTSDGAIVVYQKPTDCIKPVKKSVKNAYVQVEQDKILSDTELLKIKYTYRNRITSQYFPKFTQALATRIAAEIAFRLTNSTTKADALTKLYYDAALPTATGVDSTQGTPDEPTQDEWLNAQLMGSGNWPATTGETWHPF